MNEHINDDEIEQVLDGAAPGEHAPHCEHCRNRLAAARETWSKVLAIPSEAVPPEKVWTGIRDEMHRRPPSRAPRFVAAAAAIVLIFAGGYLTGRAAAPRPSSTPPVAVREVAAETIQRRGSEYVAALASFNSDDPYISGQAREAALSAIHGASVELVRLSPGDRALADIQRSVEKSSAATERVRF